MKSFDYNEIKDAQSLGAWRSKLAAAASILAEGGIGTLLWRAAIKASDPFVFVLTRLFLPKNFELNGRSLAYRRAWTYRTWNSERQVEIPIAQAFIAQKPPGSMLEIGNVLHNYGEIAHQVLDKYERAPGVINEDVVGYSPSPEIRHVVSVSTLEHVGRDETPRDDAKAVDGLKSVQAMLRAGGSALVTIPTGWNLPLEQAIVSLANHSGVRVSALCRDGHYSAWRQCTLSEAVNYGPRYQTPYGASAILIVEISAPD